MQHWLCTLTSTLIPSLCFQRHLIRPDSVRVGRQILVRPPKATTGPKFAKAVISDMDAANGTFTIIYNDGARKSGVRRVMIVTTS